MDSGDAAAAASITGSGSESHEEIITAVAPPMPPPQRRQKIAVDTVTESIESLLAKPPSAVSAVAPPAVPPPPPPPPAAPSGALPPPSEPGMRFEVDGTVIVVEAWPQVPTAGQARYIRYIVQCPRAARAAEEGHCQRKKRRNAGAPQCRLGQWEPVAFLLVWASMAGQCSSRAEHLKAVPQSSAIVECMRSHHWLPCVDSVAEASLP